MLSQGFVRPATAGKCGGLHPGLFSRLPPGANPAILGVKVRRVWPGVPTIQFMQLP
jgi:hypothetical protein